MPVSEYDQKLFLAACKKATNKECGTNGIGTLKEKTFMNLILPARKLK